MRVLYITTEFPPVIFGGLGTAVGGLVHALADAGTDVGVLLVGGILLRSENNSSYYGAYSHSGENNLSVTSPSTNNNITFFQINAYEGVNEAIDLIKAWAPDVLHLHTAWVWPVVEYIREKLSVPMVYTVHSVCSFLASEIIRPLGKAGIHGITWHYSRPPIVTIEYEMDVRGCFREIVL